MRGPWAQAIISIAEQMDKGAGVKPAPEKQEEQSPSRYSFVLVRREKGQREPPK